MTGGIGLIIVALLLLRIVVRALFVLGVSVYRFGQWLFEQPEGVVGATGRLLVLGLLLHTVGLL